MLYLKLIEKPEQTKSKTSRREIIKIRAIQRINDTKSCFFEKIRLTMPGKSD
jgi:hypothetical protein